MPPYSRFGLRRWCQRLFSFRNPICPILATLLVIHFFWVYYDIAITSHEHHRPKRERAAVTASSPLSPFYGDGYSGFSRAFPVWSHPFPCGRLEDEHAMRGGLSATEGFFYVKEIEASSSVFMSVAARIARNRGKRQLEQQARQQKPGTDGAVGADASGTTHNNNAETTTAGKMCTTRLVSKRARRYNDRSVDKSFLWSVVREPVSRLVSKYYHYAHIERTDDTWQNTLFRSQNYVLNSEIQDYGYYFRSLAVQRKINPYEKEHEADTRELLESYDFLGVSERMDESLAVLKIILNLDLRDVIHLPKPRATPKNSTKGNIDYYENWRKKECRPVPKPEVTTGMKQWFHSEEFEAYIEADVIFYKAVNASLDRTISELGPELVEKTVKQIRWAQKAAEEECRSVRFPCSSEGEFQIETDCFFSDIGCGNDCLDRLSETFSEDPGFEKLSTN
mmetsp:Transcript_69040/g.140381  ORF Transcript_69040/g.140381 Transcript_69040/m.140381 type:complete len:450 (-) Transcript_69040:800-2149(-)